MKDNLARTIYAEKIANEIAEHYLVEKKLCGDAKEKGDERTQDNIIFAISGKWGEGKTALLSFLEIPLKKEGFTVIKFNPWKYSQEDITLKRAFLRSIKDQLKSEVDLDDLYYDRTKTTLSLNWYNIFKGVVIGCAIYFLFIPFIIGIPIFEWLNLSQGNLKNYLQDPIIKSLATLLLVPIILEVLKISRRGANVSTAEEFEQKFNELLADREKLVIFIDDLDRCDPKTVKVILDSLRTFFQHPECSYVITGDHTVIERYAADIVELPADTPLPKKLQEGRRFLKKLFDVYWRLPLPTLYQFNIFMDDEIKNSKLAFSEPQLVNIKSFLIDDNLFERNPRHIKRFLTKLRFAIQGVQLQLEQTQAENADAKAVLSDILENPDLLAKVLLIEEFFYPIYEKLILHPEELINHEKKIRSGKRQNEININSQPIQSIIGDSMEEADRYVTLIDKTPKFTDEDNSTLHEAASFLSFSGSTGLPSALGPDESNFEQYLKTGQLAEKLGPILKVGKKDRQQKFSSKALDIFNASTDPSEQLNIISESLGLAGEIPEWTSKISEWRDKLFTLPEDQKNQLAKKFWLTVVKVKPSLLSSIRTEKPDYFESFWDILGSIEPINISKEAKGELNEIIKNIFEIQPLSLKGVEIYLQKLGAQEIKTHIDSILITVNVCKDYMDHISSIGFPDGEVAAIIKSRMEELLDDFNNFVWAVDNKEFLKRTGLFEILQNNAIAWSMNSKKLTKVVDRMGDLELMNEAKDQISANITSLVEKSADIEFLNNGNVQSLLTQDKKILIFKDLAVILGGAKESLEKRKISGQLLLKSNSLWSGVEINDTYDILKKISKFKPIKNPELKNIPQEILGSWGYAEADSKKEIEPETQK